MYASDNHATSGAHANPPLGSLICNKYKVVQQCGTGNFARVFECLDIRTNERVAIKLLKHGFERDADFECDVLNAINRHDPQDEVGVVKLIERFEWRGHAAIAFKLKGRSLRSHSMPMTHDKLVVVARDLAESLSFLHFKCRAVHTDLKPENVLEEVAQNKAARKWAICDLGSASFYTSRLDTDLITTRPYRAPEVVMSKGWSYAADTWSLGCILYELRTGRKMFDAHNDAAHLDAMAAKLGPVPGHRGSSGFGGGALATGFGFGAGSRRNSASATGGSLRSEFPDEPEFVDLLESLLKYDAGSRMKCCDIARHPYITSNGGSTSSTASRRNSGGLALSARGHPAAIAAAGSFQPNKYSFGGSRSGSSSAETSPMSSLGSSAGSRTASSNSSPVAFHKYHQAPTTATNHRGIPAPSITQYHRATGISVPAAPFSTTSSRPSSGAPANQYQFTKVTTTTSSSGPNSARPLISPAVPSVANGGIQSGAAGYGYTLGRRY